MYLQSRIKAEEAETQAVGREEGLGSNLEWKPGKGFLRKWYFHDMRQEDEEELAWWDQWSEEFVDSRKKSVGPSEAVGEAGSGQG